MVTVGAELWIVTDAVPLLLLESVAVTVKVPVVVPAVYRPLLLIVPPVADQVTGRPALSVAVNCCVPPVGKMTVAGLTVTVGAELWIVIDAVPLLLLESLAVTVTVPVVVPAVYRPPLLIVPPVADHVTGRPALSVAVNCCVPPVGKMTVAGLTVTVGAELWIVIDAVPLLLLESLAVTVTVPVVVPAVYRPPLL